MSTHVVYRCYDAADRLLYIGCTQDLAARMAVHQCDSPNRASRELVARLGRLDYEEYPNRASALAAERAAIADEAPLLNTHHNLGRRVRSLPAAERPRLTDDQRGQLADALALFAGGAA